MDLSEFVRTSERFYNGKRLTSPVVAPVQHPFVEDRSKAVIRRVDTPYFTYLYTPSILGGQEVCVKVIERRFPVLL